MAIALLAVVSTSSCSVHEWPEDAPEPIKPIPFKILLDVDNTITDYKTVTCDTTRPANIEEDEDTRSTTHDIRYILNFYNHDGEGDLDRTVVAQYIFTQDEFFNPDYLAEVELLPGKYRVMVWSDFVKQGVTEDNFYLTDNFASIALRKGTHSGCDEMRDAYIGHKDFEIVDPSKIEIEEPEQGTSNEGENGEGNNEIDLEHINDITVNLTRPMAKFRFISTDLELFVTRMIEREIEKMKARGEYTKGDETKVTVDLDDYTVVFYYSGWMPFEFNMYMDWTASSRQGENFKSKIIQLSNKEAELGFDYVFVNANIESHMHISLEVFDRDGESVASMAKYAVPLMRNKLTTVRGEFLTSKAEGSIGISPGFDDEFIVPVD